MEVGEPSSESPLKEAMEVASAAAPRTGRPVAVKPDRTERKKRGSAPFYSKRYKAGPVLLGLFVFMIAVAFFLYPRRSAVYRPIALNIHITTAEAVKVINMSVTSSPQSLAAPNGNTKAFDLSIFLETSAPTSRSEFTIALLQMLNLPAGLTPDDCSQSQLETCNFDDSANYPVLTASTALRAPHQSSSNDSYWTGYFDLQFSGQALTWNTNGLNTEAQLPEITLDPPLVPTNAKSKKWVPGNPGVTIDYYIPDPASYDWAGGPEPSVVPDRACTTCRTATTFPGYAEWDEPLSELSTPIPVNGTNNAAAEWDSFRTFAAGALVGVAGGALVGAIQEATQRKDELQPEEPPTDSVTLAENPPPPPDAEPLAAADESSVAPSAGPPSSRKAVAFTGAVLALLAGLGGMTSRFLYAYYPLSFGEPSFYFDVAVYGVTAVAAIAVLARTHRLTISGFLVGTLWLAAPFLVEDITQLSDLNYFYGRFFAAFAVGITALALEIIAAILLMVSWGPAAAGRRVRDIGALPMTLLGVAVLSQIPVLIFYVDIFRPGLGFAGYWDLVGAAGALVVLATASYAESTQVRVLGGALILGWIAVAAYVSRYDPYSYIAGGVGTFAVLAVTGYAVRLRARRLGGALLLGWVSVETLQLMANTAGDWAGVSSVIRACFVLGYVLLAGVVALTIVYVRGWRDS